MNNEFALDPRVRDEVTQAHRRISERLHPEERLRAYYSYFRERFGPDRLKNLDGEELLRTMHGRAEGDSSLAYCIEFKNDDELPAIFGSIRGGSAFKFGFYQRSGGGAWVSGGARKSEEISKTEAIQRARHQRDELVEGCRVLEETRQPGGHAPTLEHYVLLQERIQRAAPGLQNTAFGHKYFSLLFPDLLDDYHVAWYQTYHILRLLLPLPAGAEDRYANAYALARVARELGMPMNHLTTVLNEVHGDPRYHWQVPLDDEEPWANRGVFEGKGRLALGWKALPDLSEEIRTTASVGELAKRLQALLPEVAARRIRQFGNFVKGLGRRDLVLVTEGNTVVAIGEVIGPYEFDPELERGHLRPVQWLSRERWPLLAVELGAADLCRTLTDRANTFAAESQILGLSRNGAPARSADRPIAVAPRPLEDLTGIPKQIQTLLDRKGQVILFGPPGTGKTFWAMKAARQIGARRNLGRNWDDLSSGEQEIVRSRITLCTFHPAYGYEDFIERFEPYEANGQVSFQLERGVFRALCDAAAGSPKEAFYLVIDEINRGDIPRIFGELLTLLEKDKREGHPVRLPLSKELFTVPKNVFLIGTMNTADRSIALLDTALRRRFGFIELMPDASLFSNSIVGGNRLFLDKWFVGLNRRIVEETGHDGRNLQVGHSFFLSEGGRPLVDPDAFMDVFRHELIPLVQEYCYNDWAALARILGETFVDPAKRSFKESPFSSPDSFFDALITAFKPDDLAPPSEPDDGALGRPDDDDHEEA